MGTQTIPPAAKLIIGIIASSEDIFIESEKLIEERFGAADYKSDLLDFDYTDYYQKEMGTALKRRFMSFKQLIDPADLAGIKLVTNDLEKVISGKIKAPMRPVNMDPGYITEAKLVLASTKNHCHRIYLSKGIYAEITLSYRDKSFRASDMTYQDYRSDDYREIFNHIRGIFLRQRA
ncbi:MAG: DUF4416 family protein [Candidatus Omnitrophota bacterium]